MGSVEEHHAEQSRFGVYAAAEVARLWAGVGEDFDAGWAPRIAAAAAAIEVAQTASAVTSADYLPAILSEYDTPATPVGDVDTTAFSGVNRYGVPVGEALTGATTYAKNRVANGWDVVDALRSTRDWLTASTLTMVNDSGRSVVSADLAQRPALGGYVRFEQPNCCARCAVLSGKWFRWNEGFQRHNRCRGHHVPAKNEAWARAEGFMTDPHDWFRGLTTAEQDRALGKAGAQAVRDGADINRVVNIHQRGLGNATGRSGWQSRRYGTPTRVTVDDIYRAAGNDRARAVQMLLDEGYITGPQDVGGNIKGRYYEGFGQMGRGGTRVGATAAVRRSRATGIRDPYGDPTGATSLDPATQTSAERALHRAYLAKRAVDAGRNPFGSHRLTAIERQTVMDDYRRQVAALPSQPAQVRRLAALLRIT